LIENGQIELGEGADGLRQTAGKLWKPLRTFRFQNACRAGTAVQTSFIAMLSTAPAQQSDPNCARHRPIAVARSPLPDRRRRIART